MFSDRGDDTVAQVLDPGAGGVVQTTDEAGDEPLLTPAQVREALDDELTVEREIDDDRYRLLATEADGGVVVVGESLDDRDEAVASLGALLLIGGPILLLLDRGRRLRRDRRRAAPGRAHARPRRRDRGDRPRRPPAGAAGRRRDRPAGRDAQRHARPHRGGVHARADVRGRRQPRAAHAAGDPQDRARAGAEPRAHERGADRRAALGERGDRPPRRARRGPAGDRPQRPGPAADPARGAARRRAARAGPRPPRARRRTSRAADGLVAQRRPAAARAGARQPARQRAPLRRVGDRARGRGAGRRASASTSATTARASPRTSPRSSASPAATARAAAAAPASGWRSSRRSRAHTGETPAPPPGRAAAPTCGSSCRISPRDPARPQRP